MKRKKFKRMAAIGCATMLFMGMTIQPEAKTSVTWENFWNSKMSGIDYNDDGITSAEELVLMRSALVSGATDDKYDIIIDGTVNVRDLVRLKKIVADLEEDETSDTLISEEHEDTEQWSEFY